MRLGNHLASLGLCSRHGAIELLKSGAVRVNGNIPTSPGERITDKDLVIVHGERIATLPSTTIEKAKDPRVFVAYKRRGEVMTRAVGAERSFFDRPTLQQGFSQDLPTLLRSVGRLDVVSEGLVVLTDSGKFQRFMELPSNSFEREYVATCASRGIPDENGLDWIRRGAVLNGERYRPMNLSLTRTVQVEPRSFESSLTIIVKEGKFKEIREVFGSIGMSITRLKRVRFGPFQLLPGITADEERIAEVLSPLQLLPKNLRLKFLKDTTTSDDRLALRP
jgi:23S rRNA pseudouridine2605 synthase